MKPIVIITGMLFSGCTWSKPEQQSFEIKTISVGKGAGSVEVADLNHDNLPDIAVADCDDSSVTILLNKGNRIFLQSAGSPFYAGHFPKGSQIWPSLIHRLFPEANPG